MKVHNPWINQANKTITFTKHLLANLSIRVRSDQYNLFFKTLKPNIKSKVLDIGVTSDETLKDSSIFERLYKWPQNISAATIEDEKRFRKICKLINKKFWCTEANLNPLWISDLRRMGFQKKVEFRIYRTFNLFPTHIIITN